MGEDLRTITTDDTWEWAMEPSRQGTPAVEARIDESHERFFPRAADDDNKIAGLITQGLAGTRPGNIVALPLFPEEMDKPVTLDGRYGVVSATQILTALQQMRVLDEYQTAQSPITDQTLQRAIKIALTITEA